MSAQARIPPEMADSLPYTECAPDNGAMLAEDAQYDAILASYYQSLDPSNDAWGARCLVKIIRELSPDAPRVQEIARNCILLVLALFSLDGNNKGMPGTDIHQLPPREQAKVLEMLKDLDLT